MTKPAPNDAVKYHFLGSVDYAQHNFARLKPLLYSETGRAWQGIADRDWFPNEGRVFTIQSDLRYAPSGSLWTFRIAPNARGEAVEKDSYVAIQAKPAIELLIGMMPADIESLRRLVVEGGLMEVPLGKGGVAVPELNDRWVVLSDLTRDEEGKARLSPGFDLKHVKVLTGTPEELCGLPTPSGQFVLPPIHKASAERRNWLPPALFLEDLAADLKRWAPYGPQRAKAHAAAQALRDIAPHLAGVSALRSDDAKVAMARATNLTEAAETVTGAATTIIELIVEQEPFKAEISRRRQAIEADLEAEALRAVEEIEGAARDRLLAQQAQARLELEETQGQLQALRAEIQSLEEQAKSLSALQAEKVEALRAQVDVVLERAMSEPARLLAEWSGVSGFTIGGTPSRSDAEAVVAGPTLDHAPMPVPVASPIAREALAPTLFRASPAENEGEPRLLVIDAALRARELPVLIGPLAREFAEAWLGVLGGTTPLMLMTDPTLLSVRDLVPDGPRGDRAPLATAFTRARAQAGSVIVLIDDLDPAAAGFWLPELARCQRHPDRYGFPPNIHFLALIEADYRHMNLTLPRVGELFPMTFDDCDPTGALPELPSMPYALTNDLIQPPSVSTAWPARVAAFESALSVSFPPAKARSLASGFADFLQHCKNNALDHEADDGLGALLMNAALPLVREDQE
jgi:hypothetical protein